MQNSLFTVKTLLRKVKNRLTLRYPPSEVLALSHTLFAELAGISPAALYISLDKKVDSSVSKRILSYVRQLLHKRPIQHLLGKTEFYGMTFWVNEHTLIPRPETEELVDWVASDYRLQPSAFRHHVLDIGTGSGCIAAALAKNIPHSEVTAWDISEEALEVAKKNAEANKADVTFERRDILQVKAERWHLNFDVIVSNPPYVCAHEMAQMGDNVLRYEPHVALFVEDDKPLVFYAAIADFAQKALAPNGLLYVEINAMFGQEVVALLEQKGFSGVTLRSDINGRDRMVRASLS